MVTVRPAPKGMAPVDMTNVPTAVERDVIDAKHPSWKQHQEVWFNTAVMYEGGTLIKKFATKFLFRRPKEDASVYAHRLELFTYENNIGTGLGWWQAEMFSADPKIDIRTKDADGNPVTDATINPDADKYYNQQLLKDCDKHGTSFLDFYKDVFRNLLLFRECFVLLDRKPMDPDSVVTLEDARKSGEYDPYLCAYSPLDVINWDTDAFGNLNWAVVYKCTEQQRFLLPALKIERWYYYDRQQYRIYESVSDAGSTPVQQDQKAKVALVETGFHAMAANDMVPLQHIEFPEGWWLSNRAYLPATEHIDTVNVLRWSLRMAGLAVPVVCTDDDISTLTQSEYMFIKLSQGSTYNWSEPEGRSWTHLADRIKVLTEEIWRAMYLVAQSRSTSATASSQSGVSKQQDMAPSHDVLGGMGGILRAAMQNTLQFVMLARGDDNLIPDVTGFTFEDKLTSAELDVIEAVLALGIPSDLFEREVYKLAIRLVLKGANDDLLNKIFEQVMTGPTRGEQQAAQLQQRANLVRQNITTALKDPVTAGESD